MNKIHSLLHRLLQLLCILALTLITLYMFIGQSEAYFKQSSDLARLKVHHFFYYYIALTLVYLLFRVYFKQKIIPYWKLLIISLVLQCIVVLNFPVSYYYDMGFYMEHFAIKMVDSFRLDYGLNLLSYYFFNIPLVFIYTLYIRLVGSDYAFVVGYFVNIISMLLIQLAIYRIAKRIYGDIAAYRSLQLSIIFIPFYSFLPIVYNDVISTCLFIWSIYHFIVYLQSKKLIHFLAYVVLLAIGIYIRNVGSIIALASFLYLVIHRFKQYWKIALASLLLIFTLNNTSFYDSIYDRLGIYNQSGVAHASIFQYLAIGISRGVDNQTPGYYYPFDLTLFQYVDNEFVLDELAYRKTLIKFIKNRVNELGPVGLLQHYTHKYLLTWTDGQFEGNLFLGLIPNLDESTVKYYYQSPVAMTIQKPIIRDGVNLYAQASWHIIVLVTLLQSIKQFTNRIPTFSIESYFNLILLGIMSFYLLLETSPHYVFLSLPLFMIRFGNAWESTQNKNSS